MDNEVILYHPRTGHEKNYRFFWIPYSVLSISAPLTNIGIDVRIIDGNLEKHPEIIDTGNTICVGVSSMIGYQIKDALDFCKRVREESDVPIVWGGMLPTMLPKITLESEYVDYIGRGAGERIFLDLVVALRDGNPPPKGVGCSSKEIGEIQSVFDRESLPPYPFDLVDLKRYVRDDPHISERVINYVSSQGCPFGCGFCTDAAVYERKWSAYSASRTLSEARELAEEVSANGIKFYDSNFFASPSRAFEFAEGLLRSDRKFKWAASAHPRNLLAVSDDYLDVLKESGLERVLIGAESGVQEELNLINKNLKVEEIPYLADKLENHSITGSFTFVTGYPTMPEENIEATLSFAEELAKKTSRHEFKIHLYLPFPGTPLFNLAVKSGFVPPENLEGWSKMDYYKVETPWVSKKYQDVVRKFNEEHCPYVGC